MNDAFPLSPAPGFVDPAVGDEFPGLRLHWITLATRRRRSSPAHVARLSALSSRQRGATVVAMRTQPVPSAYRAFYRQIGLDPDVDRVPSERAALARMLHGGYRSRDAIADACLIALIETGVPVWALDADHVDVGGLGIRASTEAERGWQPALETYLEPGTLLVVDARSVFGLLLREPDRAQGVGARTERVALFAVAVEGVPEIHVEEALWMAAEALQ